MEELLTCMCGTRSWEIYTSRLVCTGCRHEIETNDFRNFVIEANREIRKKRNEAIKWESSV